MRKTAAFALALAMLMALPEAGAGESATRATIRAPSFTLPGLDGQQHELGEWGDKVVLLNFWSLRCGACLEEVPYLNRIHQDRGARGVAVISVVTDGVDAAATTAIMKEVGAAPAYPVLVDLDFAVSDTYTSFLVPHTLVVDRKGIIRYVHTGFQPGTEKQYEAALDRALAP